MLFASPNPNPVCVLDFSAVDSGIGLVGCGFQGSGSWGSGLRAVGFGVQGLRGVDFGLMAFPTYGVGPVWRKPMAQIVPWS